MKKYFFFLFSFFINFSLYANIQLPGILSSGMVLQQKANTKLWGWATPGEKIKINTSWDNKTITTSADGNANWKVDIRVPQAGGPYTIVFEGENKIVLENVMNGEVWICSGQSNMEWSYNLGIKSVKNEFGQLNKLNIRLFNVPKRTSKSPQNEISSSWAVCDSTALKAFSAVGYYFGKHLNQNLNVPIGLINSNWGGTPAEVWTPDGLVESNDVLKDAAAKNEPTAWWPVAPGYAYNAMIAPIVNYNIAGAIWYQGESNKNTSASYTELINTMIGAWRKAWNTELPFYYVQIAPFKYEKYNVGALLREAQSKNLSTPKTGMVVVSDLVEDTLNIHPSNKKDVGIRLANLALAETYQVKKPGYKSPVFKSFTIDKNNIIIEFENAEKGLTIKGEAAKEIFIADENKVFYPAKVKIKGNKLFVSSKLVKSPIAVRYQFSNAGIGNLFSHAGLPVVPFRTDNWVVDTSKVK